MHVYKFRDCLLNTAERSVIKEHRHLELTTKTFDVLEYLIENAGKVVSKDELLGHVWNGNFVEESNLPVHISKLRRSLSESRDCRFIETVQGTGYRFVAPLQTASEGEWQATATASRARNALEPIFGVSVNSIAVLPLQNEASDPDMEYLADGLTEGLINSLSYVRDLKVIARDTVFRYKEKCINLREISEELGVSRILTGRVRVADGNLVVGVEVINPHDGTQLWGGQYNRPFSEIIDIQQEIVSLTLKTLTQAVQTKVSCKTENAESYRNYLMGRYLLAKRRTDEVYKAIEYFRRAAAYCPTDTRSYAAIVDGYHLLHALDRISRQEALMNIKPVLQIFPRLDQSLDVVQLIYGKLKLTLGWDADSAEHHVRQALMLNPNYVEAHALCAEIMIATDRPLDAVKHTNHILELNPISLSSFKQVGRILYKIGQFEDSLAYLNDAHEMEASDFETLLLIGATLAELGDYTAAIDSLKMSYDRHQNLETLSMIGYVEGLAGRKQRANQIIQRIKSELKDHNSHAINLARIQLAMGRKEEAYNLLDEAYRQRAVDLYGLSADPRWKTLRSEPRFDALIQRVKETNDFV